jgi:flagellar protein FlaI
VPLFERDAASDTHQQVGDSQVLAAIADRRGWSDDRLDTELSDRERVLSYLVDEDVTDHREVAAVIHTYQRNPEYVKARIENEDLQPALLVGDQP